MSVQVEFTRFYRYDELVRVLQELHAAYPELTRLYSIGKSYEGRDLWLMEVTNPAAGAADDKPGYYIEANIHAMEVTGGVTALYTLHYLLTRYGTDPEVTRLVDQLTFYVLPRFTPDGVERFLTSPYPLRSSVRYYPFEEEQDGLQPEDLDGDGRIVQMRVPDPHGEWKVSEHDARLMVPRLPHEHGGAYYRIYSEGLIKNFDGVEVRAAPPHWGLDLNRQFPVNWEPEVRQHGAGPFPLSEPESRAVAEFIVAHPNICGIMDFHTTTGIILRPSAQRPDEELNRLDLVAMQAIGEQGEAVTGYPCVSIHDGFAYDRKRAITGGLIDWAYEHLGMVCYAPELWDLRVRAGCARVPFLEPQVDVEQDGLKMLGWLDRHLGGRGFFPWRPFQHPQLGPVELGGWDVPFVLGNCPPEFLAAEAHKLCRFVLRHAAAAPRLSLDRLLAEPLGEGVYRLEVIVRNTGYLPTSCTERAKEVKAVRPDYVELGLPDGAELILGRLREEYGFLDGRVVDTRPIVYPIYHSGPRERRLEWVIQARPGSELTVTASSQRGGTVRASLRLGDAQ